PGVRTFARAQRARQSAARRRAGARQMATLQSTVDLQVPPGTGEDIFEVVVLCAVLCTVVVIPCVA
ncbi:unnamed protein product, partial [Effrenium voratum]